MENTQPIGNLTMAAYGTIATRGNRDERPERKAVKRASRGGVTKSHSA